MVKDYAVTEFRMVFKPSNNPKEKLAIITCSLINSTEKHWRLKIDEATVEDMKLSLYEKAEAIRDVFVQEHHEIKEILCNLNGERITVQPKETVEEILMQIAEQI